MRNILIVALAVVGLLLCGGPSTVWAVVNDVKIVHDYGGGGAGRVVSSPPGIDCVTGTPVKGTLAATAATGCEHSFAVGVSVTLTVEPDATSVFTWGGACSGQGSCTFTTAIRQSTDPRGPALVHVKFTRTELKVNHGGGQVVSSPAGILCSDKSKSVCEHAFSRGQSVTLTSSAPEHHSFQGWDGACTGSGPCTVTMDDAKRVTAMFVSSKKTLRVTGVGRGKVTGTEFECTIHGHEATGTCGHDYTATTTVVLSAIVTPPSRFTGWSGDCSGTGTCTVEVSMTRNVFAKFEPASLQVRLTGGGSGRVSHGGIDCTQAAPRNCLKEYEAPGAVALSAHAQPGSRFVGWSGACSGTGECSVEVGGEKQVSAKFERLLKMTVTVTGSGQVQASPSGTSCGVNCFEFDAGTPVTLTATGTSGNRLIRWTGGGCSGSGPCSLTITEHKTVNAVFGR